MYIQFAELPVFDQDRAKNFYVSNFGCRLVTDVPMDKDGWRWIELSFSGSQTTLHFLRGKDEAASSVPVLVFIDEDIKGTVAALKSRNVEIVSEPQAAPYDTSRIAATFRDCEGNLIEISAITDRKARP